MELVSETESLELLWVTDAHAGVYTLTVDIGKESMHKEFTITVQTATTGLQTGEFPPRPCIHSSRTSISAFPLD